MNKQDRAKLAELVAGWEWIQGGSSSEASAYGYCARKIIREMGLTDDDLGFDRAWAIRERCRSNDDDFLHALCELAEEDYRKLTDLVETYGFTDELRKAVMP